MPYNFKFKKVEELYIQNKDIIKNNLSKQMLILNNQYKMLHDLQIKEHDVRESFNNICKGEITPMNMRYFYECLYVINENIKNQKNNIHKTEEKIDKIRKELIKANQDIQIMDKLDEKYKNEYRLIENKKFLSDVETYVVNRFNSKVI